MRSPSAARTIAHWTAGNCSRGTTARSTSRPISAPAGSTTFALLISDRYSTCRSVARVPLEFTHHPNGRDAPRASALEALTVAAPAETGVRTRAFADQAVQAALEADWSRAVEHNTKTNPTKSKTQPRLFIEDMGKTGILRLINPAPPHVVAKYSPGAEAELRERDGLIAVHARDGELLGFLEPKVGRRLLDLINTGNEYVVAVVSNDQQNPRVAIRETLQSPENAQRISFPGHHRPAETKERAYIKGNFFRFGGEGEDEPEDEGEDAEATTRTADDETGPAVAEEPLAVEADDD